MNRSVIALLPCVLLVTGLFACGGDDAAPPPPDVDAGSTDAGDTDSGPRDAGNVDAGACGDDDGDGHGALPCGDDCDDADATRFPGATEVCDGDDEDCNDTTYGADADSDGFESSACCNGADNCGPDCNDSDVNVNPDATEVCNGGIDDDCNGAADLADGVCAPCGAGYAGVDGSCTDVDECVTATTCGSGRTGCMNNDGSYICACGAGYTAPPAGGACADVNECGMGMVCGATATNCSNTIGSYICSCALGYGAPATGGACADLDECALGLCGAGMTSCTNTVGSYSCGCSAGYTSATGQPCRDLDECAAGTPCGAQGAACANVSGSYACSCNAGYDAPAIGGTCTDVNECTAGAPCGAMGAGCANTVGSYTCACTAGYAAGGPGGGGTCTDVDECALSATCGPQRAGCTNSVGSYACMCNVGYAAPATGGACVDVNECALGTDDCDDVPDACVNTAGSFTCTCPVDYVGTGRGPGGCVPRFTDLGNGTVRDNSNGLVWQQVVSASGFTQAAAVAYCASLALDGGGWRLPTIEELALIVDRRFSPTIVPTYFPGTPAYYFWSSSSYVGIDDESGGPLVIGWFMNFITGYASDIVATASWYVRCVR